MFFIQCLKESLSFKCKGTSAFLGSRIIKVDAKHLDLLNKNIQATIIVWKEFSPRIINLFRVIEVQLYLDAHPVSDPFSYFKYMFCAEMGRNPRTGVQAKKK